VDDHGSPLQSDLYGAPLTFSGRQHDTMALGTIRVAYNQPNGDAELVASMEQALPLQPDWLNFNRFALRAEKTLPLGPFRAWVRGKGGVIVGDLPPYEAFPIGGTNSVRGYSEGERAALLPAHQGGLRPGLGAAARPAPTRARNALPFPRRISKRACPGRNPTLNPPTPNPQPRAGGVGSGRSFVAGSAELRVPLVAPVEATLFGDYGSDLDSGASVLGDPAGARGKPGSGYGYGAGVRIDTPIGPLRLEYAFNDRRQTKFHLGIGYAG
jgi:outer membrane protein insertion porin family